MAVAVAARFSQSTAVPPLVSVAEAAALGASEVLARLESGTEGLAGSEATRRLRVAGPNAVRSYRARAVPVLLSQLRSPLLLLLAVTAAEALHSGIRHSCVVLRQGHPRKVDVTELVPGDVVDVQLGRWSQRICGCWPPPR